jgi:hypothetical protein
MIRFARIHCDLPKIWSPRPRSRRETCGALAMRCKE